MTRPWGYHPLSQLGLTAICRAVSYYCRYSMWKEIDDRYGDTNVPVVYWDFKEAITLRSNTNVHPNGIIDKFDGAFARLKATTTGTPPNQTDLGETMYLRREHANSMST